MCGACVVDSSSKLQYPKPPVGLKVAEVTSRTAKISWQESWDPVRDDNEIIGYSIHYYTPGEHRHFACSCWHELHSPVACNGHGVIDTLVCRWGGVAKGSREEGLRAVWVHSGVPAPLPQLHTLPGGLQHACCQWQVRVCPVHNWRRW